MVKLVLFVLWDMWLYNHGWLTIADKQPPQ